MSLSFPAELSPVSAKIMASFVKLLLEQAERQAQAREESYQAGVAQLTASGNAPPRTILGTSDEIPPMGDMENDAPFEKLRNVP